jgi:hypothetical protein
MTKLPEPFKKSGQQIGHDGNNRVFFDAYTEAQMLQFRRDALEDAARVCDNAAKPEPLCGQTDEEFACSWCADAIRKLKDEA